MTLRGDVIQILLGLSWTTTDLIVEITPNFRIEAGHLLKTIWHNDSKSFDIKELEMLVGILGR